jgi:hypothetical protein
MVRSAGYLDPKPRRPCDTGHYSDWPLSPLQESPLLDVKLHHATQFARVSSCIRQRHWLETKCPERLSHGDPAGIFEPGEVFYSEQTGHYPAAESVSGLSESRRLFRGECNDLNRAARLNASVIHRPDRFDRPEDTYWPIEVATIWHGVEMRSGNDGRAR